MSQWAHYSELDPEYAQILSQLPAPTNFDIHALRAELVHVYKARFESTDFPKSGLVVTEQSIPVQGGEIGIRIYVPQLDESIDRTYPVMVDLHGGGYCVGNLDEDDIICREVCVEHRLSVVNVDYRLAPEHPWPVGINDSYEAIKWVAKHSEEINGDLSKGFIISGLSAGAKITCVITQRARDDPELKGKISGQCLQIPGTCSRLADGLYPAKFRTQLLSADQNKDDPNLSPAALEMFYGAYKQGPADRPDVSPLLAASLANLPPAYVQVAGADPLRDEGLLYTKLMGESGVPTKLDVYPGVPHNFASAFPQLKISQKWRDDFNQGLSWLLSFSART